LLYGLQAMWRTYPVTAAPGLMEIVASHDMAGVDV
jgi:hypothetical protein